MSRGFSAWAKLLSQDENKVIYEYGSYNLNDEEYRNPDHIYDGKIEIERNCFVEPEIHEKLKKMPSGRKKLIIKRIPKSVEYYELLEEGKIIITNCSNCWAATDDEIKVDIMACHLLFYIFLRYQEEGEIQETISYNV